MDMRDGSKEGRKKRKGGLTHYFWHWKEFNMEKDRMEKQERRESKNWVS